MGQNFESKTYLEVCEHFLCLGDATAATVSFVQTANVGVLGGNGLGHGQRHHVDLLQRLHPNIFRVRSRLDSFHANVEIALGLVVSTMPTNTRISVSHIIPTYIYTMFSPPLFLCA